VGLLLQIAMRARVFAAVALAACCSAAGQAQEPGPSSFVCPKELSEATQLVLVSPKTMSSHTASLKRFERAGPSAPWFSAGSPLPAVVGRSGIRWAWNSGALHQGKGPIKKEGDGATPAGIFLVGAPFGFEPAALPGYVRLKAGRQFCVREPEAPSYNTIVEPKPAKLAAEDMGAIGLYKRGLFIEYPANGAKRGGSCIFIHVWRTPLSGTSGCVASAEENIVALQSWVRPKAALIAILPALEAEHLEACLGAGEGSALQRSRE